jgi:hypothetical protein
MRLSEVMFMIAIVVLATVVVWLTAQGGGVGGSTLQTVPCRDEGPPDSLLNLPGHGVD